MTVLLEGKKLNKQFIDKKKTVDALKDVSFFLQEGEVLGIVGESGSGKSTLLNAIAGMLKLDSGSLFYKGEEYTGQKPRKTGHFLQIVFQNPQSSFDPRMTMEQSILESRRGEKDREKMLELIKTVGLEEELLSRKPSGLSGGQCQRMSIARAFYSEASILLCDEITSALDVTTQAQVIALLKQLKEEGCFSAIFVTHDIALVSNLCDRIMVMKEGQCVEQGIAADVIQNPTDDYTKLLLESARRQSIREPEG
jgi:ABC-type glutathione transport system ATPase component